MWRTKGSRATYNFPVSDHPNWKGGKRSLAAVAAKARARKRYRQTPAGKTQRAAEKVRWEAKPESRASKAEYAIEYWQRPEVKARRAIRSVASRGRRVSSRGRQAFQSWRRRHPVRAWLSAAAGRAVRKAIQEGQIIVPDSCLCGAQSVPCPACNHSSPLEAHHYAGYAPWNWLKVVFLCKSCHTKANR